MGLAAIFTYVWHPRVLEAKNIQQICHLISPNLFNRDENSQIILPDTIERNLSTLTYVANFRVRKLNPQIYTLTSPEMRSAFACFSRYYMHIIFHIISQHHRIHKKCIELKFTR